MKQSAQEKAKELVGTYFNDYGEKDHRGRIMLCIVSTGRAKQCASICVDNILKALEDDKIIYSSEYRFEANDYWNEVKEEIEKLG